MGHDFTRTRVGGVIDFLRKIYRAGVIDFVRILACRDHIFPGIENIAAMILIVIGSHLVDVPTKGVFLALPWFKHIGFLKSGEIYGRFFNSTDSIWGGVIKLDYFFASDGSLIFHKDFGFDAVAFNFDFFK